MLFLCTYVVRASGSFRHWGSQRHRSTVVRMITEESESLEEMESVQGAVADLSIDPVTTTVSQGKYCQDIIEAISVPWRI